MFLEQSNNINGHSPTRHRTFCSQRINIIDLPFDIIVIRATDKTYYPTKDVRYIFLNLNYFNLNLLPISFVNFF